MFAGLALTNNSITDNNQPDLPISLVLAVKSQDMADTILDLTVALDIALQNGQMDTNAQDKMQYFENRQPPIQCIHLFSPILANAQRLLR